MEREGEMGEMAEMEGVLRGVLRGVQDDRFGRPTPERFHKSWVSKQGSVSGDKKKLNEEHHLLAGSGYCRLQEGSGWTESTPLTGRSITVSVYCSKIDFSVQLSISSEILKLWNSDSLWLHLQTNSIVIFINFARKSIIFALPLQRSYKETYSRAEVKYLFSDFKPSTNGRGDIQMGAVPFLLLLTRCKMIPFGQRDKRHNCLNYP